MIPTREIRRLWAVLKFTEDTPKPHPLASALRAALGEVQRLERRHCQDPNDILVIEQANRALFRARDLAAAIEETLRHD